MGFLQDWAAFSWLNRKVSRLEARQYALEARQRRTEIRMATFEEVVTDLSTVTDNLADRIEESERINAQLREAVANNDTERASALASQAENHATVLATAVERLRGLGQVTDNPVPDTTPVEPAPDAPAPVEGDNTGAVNS